MRCSAGAWPRCGPVGTSGTPSPFESCLTSFDADGQLPDDLESLPVVEASLARDEERQREKYGGASPSRASARLHVAPPDLPQHDKFSRAHAVVAVAPICTSPGDAGSTVTPGSSR